jgi:predicted nucleotidyltransferase
MTDFGALLRSLADSEVRFIVVGGAAATAHGAARLTVDLDIVYDRSRDNLQRLVKALGPAKPYLRGAPPGLPFQFDEETLRRGLNFTLASALGDIDLLGEITGGGGYADLLPHSIVLKPFGIECLCLGLNRLIQVKRAAGRAKDFDAIAELEALAQESEIDPDPAG